VAPSRSGTYAGAVTASVPARSRRPGGRVEAWTGLRGRPLVPIERTARPARTAHGRSPSPGQQRRPTVTMSRCPLRSRDRRVQDDRYGVASFHASRHRWSQSRSLKPA
jgi:hypothetical protein